MRKAFDVYKEFAKKAKSTGDNMGRKMMLAPAGAWENMTMITFILCMQIHLQNMEKMLIILERTFRDTRS